MADDIDFRWNSLRAPAWVSTPPTNPGGGMPNAHVLNSDTSVRGTGDPSPTRRRDSGCRPRRGRMKISPRTVLGSATGSAAPFGLERGMPVDPNRAGRLLLTSATNNARPGRRTCLSDFNRGVEPHESISHSARAVDDAGSSLPSVCAPSGTHARAQSSHATKSLEDSPCHLALPRRSSSLS